VADELAFPLLLRGLSHTDQWTNLRREELPDQNEEEKTPSNNDSKDEDLLSLFSDDDAEADDRVATLKKLEKAHYVHPLGGSTVDQVLAEGGAVRDVVCRNF